MTDSNPKSAYSSLWSSIESLMSIPKKLKIIEIVICLVRLNASSVELGSFLKNLRHAETEILRGYSQ